MHYSASECDYKFMVKYYCTYQWYNGSKHVHVEDV
jgi:hypothetical protein